MSDDINNLDRRMLVQEITSYNGIFIWRITSYGWRFTQAHSGELLSFYSPPFYTSRHGYKMCLKAYPKGDGIGRGTHFSLFFVVMKGEFDELLRWPFQQKVTLTLLDLSDAKEHRWEAFRPNLESNSFKKPTSDMNVPTGCPQFVSLDKLQTPTNFIRDDTLYIRVAVDPEGLDNY